MEEWTKVYDATHPLSCEMTELLDPPRRPLLGESLGLYVHSALPGDEAIVYDNQRNHTTHATASSRCSPASPTCRTAVRQARLLGAAVAHQPRVCGESALRRALADVVAELAPRLPGGVQGGGYDAELPPPPRLLLTCCRTIVFFIMNKCMTAGATRNAAPQPRHQPPPCEAPR